MPFDIFERRIFDLLMHSSSCLMAAALYVNPKLFVASFELTPTDVGVTGGRWVGSF